MSTLALHQHQQSGATWPWGERMLARIAETEALARAMLQRKPVLPDAEYLATEALKSLDHAREVISLGGRPKRRRGATMDAALAHLNTAASLVLRYMPLADLQGRLPEYLSLTEQHLPAADPRRFLLGKMFRRVQEGQPLKEEERESVVAAVQGAQNSDEREHIRVRKFCNLMHLSALTGFLLALALAVIMSFQPDLAPLCFSPEDRIVCPTGTVEFTGGDPDEAISRTASPWDYWLIELIGFVAGALAAAASLPRMRTDEVPYDVPMALSMLKLPLGALTAVLGLLLMRGDFIPGLSALDSSGQIVAWAVVFGYAQQLFTRFVDRHGQSILSEVGTAEKPKPPDATSQLQQGK
ncbi:MAG: hypothetical protein WBV82_15675 [Myxococcaceae bacterium]